MLRVVETIGRGRPALITDHLPPKKMDIQDQIHDQLSRRNFLGQSGAGIGTLALASLLNPTGLFAGTNTSPGATAPGSEPVIGKPHFPPKVKRVIYLFQSGAPSQLELFDYKPKLEAMFGQDLPESVRKGQRLTGMTAGQSSFPLAASAYKFAQHGHSQMWLSELLPHTARMTDDLCFIRTDRKSVV